MPKPRSRAGRRFWLFLTVGLVGLAGCGVWGRAVEKTGPVVLITHEEAVLPDEPATRARRKLPNEGPRIEIESPDNGQVYVELFPIHVVFSPGPKGLDVDMRSLKMTSKKLWGIDISNRVPEYVVSTAIHVPATKFPEGKHRAEIYVEDVAKNASAEPLSVIVKE